MIEVCVKTVKVNGEDKVLDSVTYKESNLGETSVVAYRLMQIVQQLLDKKFVSDIEIRKEE